MRCACGFAITSVLMACEQPAAVAPAAAPLPAVATSASIATAPARAAATADAAPSAAPATSPPDPEPDPLPPGFVRVGDEGGTPCGGVRVFVEPESPKAFRRFVRVVGADGKRLYEAHGRHFQYLDADLTVDFCGDLTGDGVPEIVMTESTMGAHCCYTRYVVSLTKPPKRILFWEKGDAGTAIMPVKYKSGPDWQLEDLMVTWPPFDTQKGDPVLSYATAPLVPVVFSLVGGDYKLTSLAFPEAYKKQRDSVRADCAKDPNCGLEIIRWIDSLAIGDWDTEKAAFTDVELRAALDRRAGEMRKVLAKYGTKARPVDPSPR